MEAAEKGAEGEGDEEEEEVKAIREEMIVLRRMSCSERVNVNSSEGTEFK